MKCGSTEEGFMNVLKELDANTNVDSVLCPNQAITITATRKNGHLSNWSLVEDASGFASKSNCVRGQKFNKLENLLSGLDKDMEFDEEFSVLCYAETSLARTWNNKIKSKWFIIDPCLPFEMKNGIPEFQIIELELEEAEYKVMMETKLAFYNVFSESIYPIRTIAFSSIGKLMDCATAFKYIADIPLGSALLLAERLTSVKNLKFIYRDKTEKIKPLIGLAGSRYIKYSQVDFFNDTINYLSSQCFYYVDQWIVSDEKTTFNVVINEFNLDYQIYFRIQTSDIPGTSISVSAYARIETGSIFLGRNTSYHLSSFEKNGGVAFLFRGLFEKIKQFKNDYETLKINQIEFDEKLLFPIYKLIGKKRCLNVKKIPQGIYSGDKLLRLIIFNTFHKLPEKQSNELAICYKNLLEKFLTKQEDKQIV